MFCLHWGGREHRPTLEMREVTQRGCPSRGSLLAGAKGSSLTSRHGSGVCPSVHALRAHLHPHVNAVHETEPWISAFPWRGWSLQWR